MRDVLASVLAGRGVRVELFNLAVTDIGRLAMALVDTATVVVRTPTVLPGPHPLAVDATIVANPFKPKVKSLSPSLDHADEVGTPWRHLLE